jgi:molecular chaperone DnaJ
MAIESEFSEISGRVFASRPERRDPERGQDLEYPISISFNESFQGRQDRITVLRKEACSSCKGGGQAPGTPEVACEACSGSGKTTRTKGHLQFAVTCGDCGGSGRSITLCQSCGGEGRTARTETLDVELPAGMATGSRVRIPGKGDAGRFGGPAGDLYVVVSVANIHSLNGWATTFIAAFL